MKNRNMKINKLFLGLAVVLMGCMASCNTDVEGEYYTPQTENVAFEVNKTSVLLPKTESSGTVPIRVVRSNTVGDYTAHYTAVASNEGIFTDDMNGTINFADGQGYVTINVTASNLEKEVPYTYTMTLSPADTLTIDTLSAHKFKEVKITVQREGDWILIGTGKFYDKWLFAPEKPGEAAIYYNEKNPSQYRIVKPFEAVLFDNYGEEYDNDYDACISDNFDGNQTNLTFTVLKPGEKLGDVTITKDNLVYYDDVNTGYFHSTYGTDIMMCHPAGFSKYPAESNWTHNCVVEWQENGLPGRVQFAPYFYMYGVGGWDNTQADLVEYFDFPGFEMKDYTLEMEYTGIFTDPSNVVHAVANLTLGADATNVKAVIVTADDDAGAVADAIVAGDLEGYDVEGGYAAVPIPEGLTGKLQMVVVVIDGGVAKVVDSVFFEYYGGGDNPWKSLGMGYWTDDIVTPLFTEAGDVYTYQVEIEEHKETPGLYRVLKAYAPVATAFKVSGGDKNIEINAEDPSGVYILNQEIGLDFGRGAMSIETDGGYYVSKYGFDVVKAQAPETLGKVENGVITFPTLQEKSSSGAMVDYQIWLNMGESSYFGGRHGEFKIVLPGAPAPVMKKAKSMAKATEFELRLNKYAPKGVKSNRAKAFKKISLLKVRDRDAMNR